MARAESFPIAALPAAAVSNSGLQVQQAGKKDDTDRKIEKFEAAKRVRAVDRAGTVAGTDGSISLSAFRCAQLP